MARSGAADVKVGSKAGKNGRLRLLRLHSILQPAGFGAPRGRLGYLDGGLGLGYS